MSTALEIIGCTVLGSFLGGAIGGYHGLNDGGDLFGFAVMIYGLLGMVCGALAGASVGAVVFT